MGGEITDEFWNSTKWHWCLVDEVLRHANRSWAHKYSSNINMRWNEEKDDFYHSSNPLYPESDQHLISVYSNTAESFIKITRIKKMITNLRSFDWWNKSPVSNKGDVWRRVRRIWILMSGCKGFTNYFDCSYFGHWNSNRAVFCVLHCLKFENFPNER